MLSSWGVTFEPVDTESNPEALRELERFGVRLVPAVIMGDRAFHGWNPKKLANFVGVQYVEPERLSWAELTNRLDRILAAAQRAMRQVPDKHLGMVSPDRNRTVRNIGYHVFRLSLAHRDAMEQSRFPEEWLLEEAPPNIVNGAQLAQYGQTVRDRLREWFSQPGACDGGVKTYYGYQTAHELLERTVWHAAQHLRQLYVFLERMGERPVAPLTDAEFRGLPLPKEVWSQPVGRNARLVDASRVILLHTDVSNAEGKIAFLVQLMGIVVVALEIMETIKEGSRYSERKQTIFLLTVP